MFTCLSLQSFFFLFMFLLIRFSCLTLQSFFLLFMFSFLAPLDDSYPRDGDGVITAMPGPDFPPCKVSGNTVMIPPPSPPVPFQGLGIAGEAFFCMLLSAFGYVSMKELRGMTKKKSLTAEVISAPRELSYEELKAKEKLQNLYESKIRCTNETKEKHSLPVGESGVKEATGSLHNGFCKPKLSRKTILTKGGPNFLEKKSKLNNIASNITSFLPLAQRTKTAAVITGKRDVKVKALEAAEAARRLEKERENERKMKKEALKLERARLERKKLEQLELKKKKKKEEERMKKEARKRQKEEEERKEKEAKRKRTEGARNKRVNGKKPTKDEGNLAQKPEHELRTTDVQYQVARLEYQKQLLIHRVLELERKHSRQVKICTEVPPSSNKRCFYGV